MIRTLPSRSVLRALLLAGLTAGLLAGCGGGATATSTTTLTNGGTTATVPTTNAGTGTVCPTSNAQNSIARNGSGQSSTIYMDLCPISTTDSNGNPQLRTSANIPYVSVYVCAPGSTTNCAWIDHIEVDTGSEGLRVLASAIPTNVLAGLGTVTAANFAPSAPPGNIGECYAFVSSFFWGGVRSADITLGGTVAPPGNPGSTGLTARGMNLQVLNDTTVPSGPPGTNCNISGQTSTNWVNTANDIRANGILGIGLFADDCHSTSFSGLGACSTNGSPAAYYSCANTTCTAVGPGSTFAISGTTVANPVSAVGRNGTSLTLNSGSTSNSTSVAGALNYGISTPPATVLVADPINAYITSTVNNVSYPVTNGGGGSYIDSGSNAIYFSNNTPANSNAGSLPDQSLPGIFTCPLTAKPFACTTAAGTLTLPTRMGSYTSPSGTFTVTPAPFANDAQSMFNTSGGPAYEGLSIVDAAYTAPGIFAWGLPFFYSRTVYFGIYNGLAGTPYYGF